MKHEISLEEQYWLRHSYGTTKCQVTSNERRLATNRLCAVWRGCVIERLDRGSGAGADLLRLLTVLLKVKTDSTDRGEKARILGVVCFLPSSSARSTPYLSSNSTPNFHIRPQAPESLGSRPLSLK